MWMRASQGFCATRHVGIIIIMGFLYSVSVVTRHAVRAIISSMGFLC